MRIRRPSHATVVAYLALFVALGGTAYASVIITNNSQVDKNTISGHRPPNGKHANIIAGSISGKDIADRSGVDTCKTPLVAKFGTICAGSDGGFRTWQQSVDYCASFGLRLPSLSEAVNLAHKYDVPGVSANELFWTDEEAEIAGTLKAREVNDDGNSFFLSEGSTNKAVCVTDPSA
jgi:hypothetical protein